MLICSLLPSQVDQHVAIRMAVERSVTTRLKRENVVLHAPEVHSILPTLGQPVVLRLLGHQIHVTDLAQPRPDLRGIAELLECSRPL